MTDWREELVEKMAKAFAVRPQDSEDRWWIWEPEARAALAVAEPVIREQADNALREENARLRAALIDTLASLVASVDLLERGGKKAAPSDKMFAQMLDDYKNRIERGRAAVAAIRDSRNCVPEGGKVENQTKLD